MNPPLLSHNAHPFRVADRVDRAAEQKITTGISAILGDAIIPAAVSGTRRDTTRSVQPPARSERHVSVYEAAWQIPSARPWSSSGCAGSAPPIAIVIPRRALRERQFCGTTLLPTNTHAVPCLPL